MIQNYNDFINALLDAGFSMGGENNDGIYSVLSKGWDEATPIRWHTGDAETDPWEWRMRVLSERSDIVYSKLFFKKSGYITKDWYAYFLAARRGASSFDDGYLSGNISHFSKRIYDVVAEYGSLPLHTIKQLAKFSKEDKSRFDSALTELQMRMYLTMCGRQQKLSKKGEEYGWSSTVFCTAESFFDEDIFAEAARISTNEAVSKITEQILKLNPNAVQKKIIKFIMG